MNAQLIRSILSLTLLTLVVVVGFSVNTSWAFGFCEDECEGELLACEWGAEDRYDDCVDLCEGDPFCEDDCYWDYERDLIFCEEDYEYCMWFCEA